MAKKRCSKPAYAAGQLSDIIKVPPNIYHTYKLRWMFKIGRR